MKILHLTDFHYRSDAGSKADQDKLVDCLCKTINGEKIDLILFSGDLVNKGNKLDDFREARKTFLNRIANATGVKVSNIIICGGNHDIHRDQELNAIRTEFDKIDSAQAIDDFIRSQGGKQFTESLKNLDNYISFQNEFYDYTTDKEEVNSVKELYSIHKRIVNGKRVGIATINTAWRSSKSELDRGNLFYPTSYIKSIVADLNNNVDFKILLLHHPLSDLKLWNAHEAEDLIHNGFHVMFSGHVHKRKNSTFITNDEGIFCCVSPASLSLYDNDSKIGFSILDIDLDVFNIEIHNKIYDKNDNIFFHQTEPFKSEVPLHGEKRDQNDFRKTLRKILAEEIERANDLFISSSDSVNLKPFLDLFTPPIIKAKSKTEIANKRENTPTISIEEIIGSKTCYLLFGKDKSGKTSLLYKTMLDLLSNFSTQKIIPYYIDCRKYKSTTKPVNFENLLSQYFQIGKSKLEEFTEKYHFKLLIDNYDPTNTFFNEQLSEYLKSHTNISFITTTEETLTRSFEALDFGDKDYTKIFLHEISRNEVRTLTNKWPSIPKDKKEIILDKISQIFFQLNMPMNYWTVSLFLWIFEKTNEANFHNNFELIQLYIDNLLDRRRLALDKSIKIDYEDFKSYLGELAYELITNHKDSIYSADYAQLIAFTELYRNRNKRFVIPVKDVVDLIIEKGVLKKTFEEKYTFRLNGVFEYFLAFYMKDNPTFRDGVINDGNYYLSFSNELELYSGFNKKDKTFVEQIFKKTNLIFEPINTKYKLQGTTDVILLEKISDVFDITTPLNQLVQGKRNILAPEKQDALIEEFKPIESYKVEVTEKKFYDKIELTSENLEKTLFILSRVYRNSSINDESFNNKVLDFILDSACNLGFLLIDESNPDDSANHSDISNDEDGKLLMKIITNFMPLLVQTFLFDALAQNNLERIFLEKIEEFKKDKDNNQFKLLVLYFLLIDLDVKANKKYIDEVIDNTKHGILKQTTIVKLYTYLIFKSYNQPEFEQFLREKIQKQSLKIDPKTDKGILQQTIEKNKKIMLLKKEKR